MLKGNKNGPFMAIQMDPIETTAVSPIVKKAKRGRPATGRKPFRVSINPKVKRAASRLAYQTSDRSLSALIERLLAEELAKQEGAK